jgi:hypothetical protein
MMPKLTLNISKLLSNLGNNSVGEKGAIIIANNLKHLTTLGISKQWSYSENNKVGDLGAIAIADELKNFT